MEPPYLEPTTQAFINAIARANQPPIHERGYDGARAIMERIQTHDQPSDVTSASFEIATSFGNAGMIEVTLYKPATAQEEALPVVIYCHGGGWFSGSISTYERLVCDLVRESGCALVFPSYSLAPEAVFPTQIEQSYEVLEWVAQNGASKGLKTDRFVVAGDSAGGHMAIGLSAMSAARSGPKIVYEVLFYPVTSTNSESGGYESFAAGPYLTPVMLHWMYGTFFSDKQGLNTHNSDSSLSPSRATPLGSPLMSTEEQLKQLPPTLIIVSAADPLRCEGEEFGHRLQKAGVKTAIFVADGQVHDFAMLNVLASNATAVAAIELAGLKVRKALA